MEKVCRFQISKILRKLDENPICKIWDHLLHQFGADFSIRGFLKGLYFGRMVWKGWCRLVSVMG